MGVVREEANYASLCKKLTVISASSAFVFSLLALAIPSKMDIALILGGSYLTQVEEVGEITPNAVKVLNRYLEEEIGKYEEKSND